MQLISYERKLPKRVIRFWVYYTSLVFTIILLCTLTFIILSFALNWNKYISYSFLTILFFTSVSFPIELLHVKKIKYSIFSYNYSEKIIEIEYGWWFFKSYKIIPISNIYSSDIYQGPILKKFNLYNLKLITMANTHEIEGLDLQDAKKIQDKLQNIER
ncbi:PH domain-containing protein [Staphylococcus edaphicus]|uniref:PH domain-containing protein n=1 Tax=Staphylococcus edaphicus TaxID=1955013 RepID=UPI00137AA2FC|nr:PH domain-containing protein [Staphylococcus edaphicus]